MKFETLAALFIGMIGAAFIIAKLPEAVVYAQHIAEVAQ